MRHPFTALTLILATVTAVTLADGSKLSSAA